MICEREVKKYCKDYTKIENYEKAIADTTQVWECHHRMELIVTGAVVDSTLQDLKDWGIYYNRPADELIFLTSKEHRALHNKGKQHSEESKKKMSAALKGKKRKPFSAETKAKMSSAHRGKYHSEEAKAKMSATRMGKKHSEETRAKVSAAIKGLRWYTNGVKNIRSKECPDGYWRGRTI